MVGWHHRLDGMSLSKLWELVMDREAWRAAVQAVTKSLTWLSDWTELKQAQLLTLIFWSVLSIQFSPVQSLSHVWLFETPWTAAWQAYLSITNSWSLLRLMSIASVKPSNNLILCCPLLLPPSVFPSIRVFSNESVLRIRWPKYLEFQLQHQSFQWIFRTDFL